MEERRMKTDKTYWLVWGMILAIIILLLLIGYVFPPTSSVRIDDGWSFLDYVSLLYFKSASYIIILLSNVAVGLTLVLTVRYLSLIHILRSCRSRCGRGGCPTVPTRCCSPSILPQTLGWSIRSAT